MYSKFHYKSYQDSQAELWAKPLSYTCIASGKPPHQPHTTTTTGGAHAPCEGSAPCIDVIGTFLFCSFESKLTSYAMSGNYQS